MNVITILNTILANASADFKARVPVATQTNIEDYGAAVMEYEPVTNEFIKSLINNVCYVSASNRRFTNPLSKLKSAAKPFGYMVGEVHTNPAKDKGYDISDVEDLLSVDEPDMETIYHRENRKSKYKVSISIPELQKAFTSYGEMEALILDKTNSLYSGDEIDEYTMMRLGVSNSIKDGKIKTIEVEYTGDEATSKELIKVVKTLSNNLTFPSKDYNGYNIVNAAEITAGTKQGRISWTPKENQILLIRSDVDACTDVEVLAKAFNMDKVEFGKRKIVVDHFMNENTIAMVCDERFFRFQDTLYRMGAFENPSNLVTSTWLHHWQIISLSLFANAVAINKTATETTEG